MLLLDYVYNSSGLITRLDYQTLLLYLGFLLVPFILLLIPLVIDFQKIWNDIKYYTSYYLFGSVCVSWKQLPIGLKHILNGLGFRDIQIRKVKRISWKSRKKINTEFSYIVYTSDTKFQIYYQLDGDEYKWMFYKRSHFDNKPIRIKDNYYKIIEVINGELLLKIRNRFKTRLSENGELVMS